MVPLDGTAAAEAALPLACALARALDAQLRLVMVVPTLETVAGEQQPQATFLPGTTRMLLEAQEEQAAAYLDDLGRAAPQRPASRRSPRSGAARRWRNWRPMPPSMRDGLVVAATHGRAGLQAIWSTSVATRLLKRTNAPILLVPIVEPPSATPGSRPARGGPMPAARAPPPCGAAELGTESDIRRRWRTISRPSTSWSAADGGGDDGAWPRAGCGAALGHRDGAAPGGPAGC